MDSDTTPHPRGFASDNASGIHPEVLAAIAEANVGHAPAYGADAWTERFGQIVRDTFGPRAEAFPVFSGTGANVLALQAALPRWGAVICAASAHIAQRETGAPEKTAGIKLLPVSTPDGKLTPELVAAEAWGWGDFHRAQPLAISIAQVTEYGTCYSPDEIRALADYAHAHGMVLHVDGARLGNAAAHLGSTLAAITSEAGVDVLSLGGTKNGLLGAEAVIALSPDAVPGLGYLRKTVTQLSSKMRFVSAQLNALYEGDLWRRSADHANAMATRLRAGLDDLAAHSPEDLRSIRIPYPTESNLVLAYLPPEAVARARAQFRFNDWPGEPGFVRFMCSFDTTPDDVDALLAALRG